MGSRICMFNRGLSMLLLRQVRPEGDDVVTYQASAAALGQVSETVVSSRKKVARFGLD